MELARIYGPVVAPYCSCLDLLRACQMDDRSDCDKMSTECNRTINSGGQFCLPNQWGGQSCYK